MADCLDVDLRAELHWRVEHKKNLPEDEQQQYRVLDTEQLWSYIKANTHLRPEEWADVTPTLCRRRAHVQSPPRSRRTPS
jgi:hypothetical protein